jgi:Sec-independent protein translocase protein TatA
MPSFLQNIGPTELILLAIIIVALFGSKILISLGKTAGESFKEIKNIKKTFKDAVENEDKEDQKTSES